MVLREIQVLPNAQSVAEEGAKLIVGAMLARLKGAPFFSLALAGGTTPRLVYERLAQDPRIPWNQVHLFWGDERAVAPDHGDSNYRMVETCLLERINIPEGNVHCMLAEGSDLKNAARLYEQTLVQILGKPPRLDLVLLGLGEDGHTASLFPHHAALAESVHWVTSTPAPVLAPRLTLTFPTLNAARQIMFLVTGAAKAQPLQRVWATNGSTFEIPARGVQPDSGRLLFLVDADANTPPQLDGHGIVTLS